ncbi:MAG: site-specific integrase [Smithella sp.]|jgi:integrase
MAIKWIKTAHKGLRYYEHETRKHGKKRDRYYSIRFKADKVDHSYGIGWLSDGIQASILEAHPGIGFEEHALMQLRMYKLNTKEQSGAKSPKERRQLAKEFREAEKEAKAQVEKENVTFGEYFQEDYFPTSLVGKKKGTSRKEVEHFKNWIQPIIGKMPFKEIKPFTIEKIKKNILADGKSPRSLQYVFATIRQVWNMARRDGLISGDSPTKQVKIPKIDNKRIRFLSHEEADLLLEALKEDPLTHDLALLSLQTGLRVGEMAKLKWSHIDLDRGIIHVMDSKGGKGRVAYITKKLKTMLKARKRRGPNDHVFIRQDGELITDMPRIFFDVVNDLGFNNDITDSRQKVVAHTLRHTFASWHVEAGTDLYTLKTLMGHSVMAMTERYAHLSNGTLQNATANFEKANKASAKKAGQVVNFKK